MSSTGLRLRVVALTKHLRWYFLAWLTLLENAADMMPDYQMIFVVFSPLPKDQSDVAYWRQFWFCAIIVNQ